MKIGFLQSEGQYVAWRSVKKETLAQKQATQSSLVLDGDLGTTIIAVEEGDLGITYNRCYQIYPF
jgi:hypothetical protein